MDNTISKAGGILSLIENNNIYIILVLGKKSKKWGLPKGSVELNETAEQASKREVFEETGINIENHKKIKVLRYYKFYYNLVKLSGCKDNYELKTNDKNEILSVKWFSIEEINNMNKSDLNITVRDFLIKKKPWEYLE